MFVLRCYLQASTMWKLVGQLASTIMACSTLFLFTVYLLPLRPCLCWCVPFPLQAHTFLFRLSRQDEQSASKLQVLRFPRATLTVERLALGELVSTQPLSSPLPLRSGPTWFCLHFWHKQQSLVASSSFYAPLLAQLIHK